MNTSELFDNYERNLKYPLETTLKDAWEQGFKTGVEETSILFGTRVIYLEERIRELESQIYGGSTK